MPTTQPGRRYPFRSRVRCNACQHRMLGIWRPGPTKANPDAINIYYPTLAQLMTLKAPAA